MKKSSWKWGGIIVFITIIISILLLFLPCKPYYVIGGFFGAVCQNDTWFTLINLPGAIVIKLITGKNLQDSIIIKLGAMLINIPIYFYIGLFLNKIFNRKNKC